MAIEACQLSLKLADLNHNLLQFPNLDIAEPDRITMILQADIPFMGNAFLEALEIFEFAIGNHIIPFFAPQSILNDLLSILGMRHFAILHLDHDRVPFAGRFYRFRIGSI